MTNGEHWRWDANTTWHYFCSTQYGAAAAREASNEFIRYHHVRSSIYFAIGTIESLLNQEMRRHLEKEGLIEEEIFKTLYQTRITEKMNKWPTVVGQESFRFDNELAEVFDAAREIRNEVTHPKRKDHSIYRDLDNYNPDLLVRSVATYLVLFWQHQSRPFPYWVLGWNYVGLNGDPSFPTESNNVNGFFYSLQAMGFQGLGRDLDFEKRHMSTLENYTFLKGALDQYPKDIEPYWPRFPLKPLLTRRWWDREFLINTRRAAQQNTE